MLCHRSLWRCMSQKPWSYALNPHFLDVSQTPHFFSRGIHASICGHILRQGRWQIPMSVLANAENRNLSDLYRAPWRKNRRLHKRRCKQAKNNRTMCGIWMTNFYDFVEYVNTYAYIFFFFYLFIFGCLLGVPRLPGANQPFHGYFDRM